MCSSYITSLPVNLQDSIIISNRKWKCAKRLILISYEGVKRVDISRSIVMCIKYQLPCNLTIISASFHWQIGNLFSLDWVSVADEVDSSDFLFKQKFTGLPDSITKTIMLFPLHRCRFIFSLSCRDLNAQLQTNANKPDYYLYHISLQCSTIHSLTLSPCMTPAAKKEVGEFLGSCKLDEQIKRLVKPCFIHLSLVHVGM